MRGAAAALTWLVAVSAALSLGPGNARAEYLPSKACAEQACKLESPNFRVLYDSEETTDAFADHILVALEKAHDVIVEDWNYALPSEMEDAKVDVTIKDLSARGALGVTWTPQLWAGSMAITLEREFLKEVDTAAESLHKARSTAGHEFFHLVQGHYVGLGKVPAFWTGRNAELRWAFESTASWVEQHIYQPARADLHLYSYFDRLVGPEHWRVPLSATTLPAPEGESGDEAKQRKRNAAARPYEASSFIEYLTENHGDGKKLVRTFFEQLGDHLNPDVWSALPYALGDKGGFGRATRDLVADFSVAAFILYPRFHPDYSFDQVHRGLQVTGRPSFHPAGLNYYDDSRSAIAFDGATLGQLSGKEIVALTRSVSNLAFDYVELAPFALQSSGSTVEDELRPPSVPAPKSPVDVQIAVAAEGGDWAFHLIEIPLDGNYLPQKDWTVREMPLGDDGTSAELLVKDLGGQKRAVVVAANLKSNDDGEHDPKRQWKLLASVVEPLVVTDIAFSDLTQLEVFWSLKRTAKAAGGWAAAQPVTTGIPHRPGKHVHVRIETNRKAEGPLTLRLGTLSWQIPSVGGLSVGEVFEADIDIDELAVLHLEEGESTAEIAIAVEGEDDRGLGFDGVPATPVDLFAFQGAGELRNWEGDGIGAPGGPDRFGGRLVPLHRMALPPFLAGVRVYQQQAGNRTLVYDAAWQKVPELSIRRLDVRQASAYDPEKAAELELEFSTELIAGTLAVDLEGNGVSVSRDEDRQFEIQNGKIEAGMDVMEAIEGTGAIYTGTIEGDLSLVDVMVERGELVLSVAAKSKAGMAIDGDPGTQAYYDYPAAKWSGYGDGESAVDRHHRLGISGKSYLLLLDASGSMNDDNRLEDAKAGILEALQAMNPSDEVALVVFYDCKDVRLEQSFSTDRKSLWRTVEAVQPGAGTPLGDATLFARRYMEKNARYPGPKLLVFSDGASNCGQNTVVDAAKPAKTPSPKPAATPEPGPEPEPAEASVVWWAYRVETQARTYGQLIDVVELFYEEAEGGRPWARLTVKRYPVSTLTSSGRTIWSIGWTSGETEDSQRAEGEDVAALRTLAEQLRDQGFTREKLGEAVAKAIGPGAEALSSR